MDEEDEEEGEQISEEDEEADHNEEVEAEDAEEDDAVHPDAIEGRCRADAGNSGGMFFIEAEGTSGETIERHVRHLSVRELHQLLTYGMAAFGDDDPVSDESEEDASGVCVCLTQIMSRWRMDRNSGMPQDLWDPVTSPVRAGQELERSGDFGMARRSAYTAMEATV